MVLHRPVECTALIGSCESGHILHGAFCLESAIVAPGFPKQDRLSYPVRSGRNANVFPSRRSYSYLPGLGFLIQFSFLPSLLSARNESIVRVRTDVVSCRRSDIDLLFDEKTMA